MNCIKFKASPTNVIKVIYSYLNQNAPGTIGSSGILMSQVIEKCEPQVAATYWIKCFLRNDYFGSKKAESDEDLNQTIEQFFNTLNKFKIDITDKFKEEFSSQFKDAYNPIKKNKEKEETDDDIQRIDEAVDGTFLEITNKKLFEKTNAVFKDSAVSDSVINEFKSNMIEHVYINLNEGKIIYNNPSSFNHSVSDLKEKYFATIAKYLEGKNIKIANTNLFDSEGNLNPELNSIMFEARNLINQNIENGTHFDNVKKGWNSLQAENMLRNKRDYSDPDNQNYFEFVNAFFVLSYFDTFIRSEFPSVKFAKSLENIMTSKKFIKYGSGVDKKGRYTGFSDDNKRNGFTEAGRESTAILEALPLLSYNKYKTEESDLKRKGLHISLIRTTRVFNKLRELLYNSDSILESKASENSSAKKRLNNALLWLHKSPKQNIKIILDSLFLGEVPIINTLINNNKLSENEVDTLFSLWKNVYNTTNPETRDSIMKIENKDRSHKFSENLYSDYITGLIDRVTELKYLSVQYDQYSGNLLLNFRKKFVDNRLVFESINKINQYATKKSDSVRHKLNRKYEIKSLESTDPNDKNAYEIILKVPKSRKENGFTIREESFNETTKEDTTEWVENDLKIIVRPNYNKKEDNDYGVLSATSDQIFVKTKDGEYSINEYFKTKNFLKSEDIDDAQTAYSDVNRILMFFKDALNIDFLENNNLSILQFAKMDSTTIMGDTAKIAIKAILLNNLVEENTDESNLCAFAIKKYGNIFNNQIGTVSNGKFQPNSQSRMLEELGLNNYQLNAVNRTDQFFDTWAFATQIYNGEKLRSTSTNFEGHSEQNGRTNFLGAQIHTYIAKIKSAKEAQLNYIKQILEDKKLSVEEKQLARDKYEQESMNISSANLLFSQDTNLGILRGSTMSSDIKARDESVKSIKALKASELLYTHIWHNFYGTLYNEENNKNIDDSNQLAGKVLIQPTVYSDKSSIIDFIIKLGKITVGDTQYDLNKINFNDSVNIIVGTVGKMYENICDNVIKTYNKLFSQNFNSLEEVDSYLRSLSYDEYRLTSDAQKNGIRLTRDVHYVIDKGKISINPLLNYYAKDLYGNPKKLKERLIKEKLNFVNSIIKSGIYFYTSDSTISNALNHEIKQANDRRRWVRHDTLVIAIGKNKDGSETQIIQGNEIDSNQFESIELNPLLEKYFNLQTILGLNLRLTLTGSDIGHPIEKAAAFKRKGDFINILSDLKISKKELGYSDEQNLENLSYIELRTAINNIKNNKKKAIALIEYDKLLTKMSGINANGTEGAQLKRNVIIPATLQYVQQNCINGVPKRIKIAVIDDIKAYVNSFDGLSTSEDSCDGSAIMPGFLAEMINRSLQDQAVGKDMKPIWHNYDIVNSTAGLLKYAMFAMTNLRMQQSLGSDLKLYNLFKKMCNLQWSEESKVEIDLINGRHFGHTSNGLPVNKIDFKNDILRNEKLMYGIDGSYREIIDLRREKINGHDVYYTYENVLTADAQSQKTVKVYHLFERGTSKHLKLNYQQVADILSKMYKGQYHTINSLFELHAALGGVFCCTYDQNSGRFVSSEKNQEALANYINIIGYYRSPNGVIHKGVNIVDDLDDRKNSDGNLVFVKADYLNQENYYQPLKELFIGVAANPSAMKTGVTNVNRVESWTDDSKLNYMEFESDGFGIQQDSDHEADEAELTEPSQVMTALDQGGWLHPFAKQIYLSLGKTTLSASHVELETIADYLTKQKNGDPNAINNLYDLVGRIIINNLDSKDSNKDLSQEIILEIKKEFNVKSNDHRLDELKIAFSDPNLFGHVLPSIISVLNAKGIRRKNPGSGMVMVPSYRMFQTYKIDGKVITYNDLIKQIKSNIVQDTSILDVTTKKSKLDKATGNPVEVETTVQINGFINDNLSAENVSNFVQEYLNKKQEELDTETIKSGKHLYNDFDLNDVVNIKPEISSNKNNNGEPFTAELYIDSIKKYYLFKDAKWLELSDKKKIFNYIYNILQNYRPDISPEFNFIENQLKDLGLTRYINEILKPYITNNYSLSKEDLTQITFAINQLENDNFLKLYDYNTLHYFENITKPRDLAPTRIQFTEVINGVSRRRSFYDIPIIREAFGTNNKKTVPKREMQALFEDLSKNHLYHDKYIRDASGKVIGEGEVHQITDLTYYKPQAIISNLTANRFNGTYDQTLNEFENNTLFNAAEFETSLQKIEDVIPEAKLRFLKANGKHVYVRFDSINKVENTSKIAYEKSNVSNYRIKQETFGDLTVYKTILLNKANEDLYEIGRDVEIKNYKIDKNGKILDDTGKVVDDKRYKIINGKVFKSFKYLNRFNRQKKSGESNTVFNIDRDMVKEFTSLTKESENEVLNDIITNLYKQDTYIAFDQNIEDPKDRKQLFKGISQFDPNLKEYVNEITKTKGNPNLTKLLQQYEREIKTSFEISKYIIASRIPAQTLQSFMPMEVVGYTQMQEAVAYVSSIQTFLQGSDYK